MFRAICDLAMKMRQMITRRVVLNAYRMFLSLRKRKRHLIEENKNNKKAYQLAASAAGKFVRNPVYK